MKPYTLLDEVVRPVVAVVEGIDDDALEAPTPCTEFDVRALLTHLLRYGPSLEAAARKQTVPEAEPPAGDPRPAVVERLTGLAAAWGTPEAWEGETAMGGNRVAAPMFGGMVVAEVVLHGWDLARATGQDVAWSEEVAAYLRREVEQTAELGRGMGLYGEAVPVADDASDLDRALAVSGRNPNWNGTFRSAKLGA